jgi:UDP-N-acetylmuramyl pentapeptide phosphotransferase/UDP-N-acetylglucosamine-1-phosphate transferase
MLEYLCFLIGLTLICGVSLWDDISSLPDYVRVVVHFSAVGLMFCGLGLFVSLPYYLTGSACIVCVGILNAYNFMDGINGMTGLYSLSVLISLQYVNYRLIPFTDRGFINYVILACLVFLFFNFRKRARCFAGDVGSMGISFWILMLLLQLMSVTHSLIWILFLALYGVDAVCTILHRLYLQQNIFEAHRMHFYQILSNEKGISHRKVSALYAGGQLFICIIVVYVYTCFRQWDWAAGTLILILLLLVYMLKFKL